MPGTEKNKKESSPLSYIIATLKAAGTRTVITYPFERVSRNLQYTSESLHKFMDYKRIVLGNHFSKPLKLHDYPMKYGCEITKELYKGAVPWGFTYKGVQLTTLGLLKPLQDNMKIRFKDNPIAADVVSSGIMAGIQTPLLQFLNNMKVLHQAGTPPQFSWFAKNAPSVSKTPIFTFIGNPQLFKDLMFIGKEYFFKNTSITFARNFSFVVPLTIVRSQAENYFSHSGERKLTTNESIASAAIGSAAGLIISSPYDVMKTRMQLLPLGTRMRILQMFITTIEKEGMGALTKGLSANGIIEFIGLLLFFSLQHWFSNKKEESLEKKSGFFATKPKKLLELHDPQSDEAIHNPFSCP